MSKCEYTLYIVVKPFEVKNSKYNKGDELCLEVFIEYVGREKVKYLMDNGFIEVKK